MAKAKRKRLKRLKARIDSWITAPSGARFPQVSDSPNRNQVMHKPGSQNRKK